eukprot:TRINITY_DN43188_c0_g1_i1.p1 TRINITY_DN43188_c0_g1~~TRINITY_DN43188_c0_g1_i1.p1  ORF type:complete len:329 (+),score=97.83 TRINITY_DN43188_c0_g1_i1:970-1956(+)
MISDILGLSGSVSHTSTDEEKEFRNAYSSSVSKLVVGGTLKSDQINNVDHWVDSITTESAQPIHTELGWIGELANDENTSAAMKTALGDYLKRCPHDEQGRVCKANGVCDFEYKRCTCNGLFFGSDCENMHCAEDCEHDGTCNFSKGKCDCIGVWGGDWCKQGSCGHGWWRDERCECDRGWGGDNCEDIQWYTLRVRVNSAHHLPKDTDGWLSGSIDPYIVVTINGNRKQTRHIDNNNNPSYNENFDFGRVQHGQSLDAKIYVMDQDPGSADDHIEFVNLNFQYLWNSVNRGSSVGVNVPGPQGSSWSRGEGFNKQTSGWVSLTLSFD